VYVCGVCVCMCVCVHVCVGVGVGVSGLAQEYNIIVWYGAL